MDDAMSEEVHASGHEPVVLFGVTSSTSVKLIGPLPVTLARAGWEVHIATDISSLEPDPQETAATYHHIPMSRTPSILRDVQALVFWLKLIKEIKPDLVAIGTPKAALLGIVASRVNKVPVRIYVLRGLRLETSTGIERIVMSISEWLTARFSTQILSVSHSLKETYTSLNFAKPEKVTVIGSGSSHGVNKAKFSDRNLAQMPGEISQLSQTLRGGGTVFGFVGRLTRDKGVQDLATFAQAWNSLGLDYQILVVGPAECKQDIIDEIHRAAKKSIFVGEVSNTAPFFSLFDVLLLPTRREGFPNVVLEAACAGKPAVAYSVTGARDSIIHGETGLLIPPGDRIGFSNAAAHLASNEALRTSMGERARERALREFDELRVTDSHRKFYSRLVANAKNTYPTPGGSGHP